MAHEGLWQQLIKLDRQKTAVRAKCQYKDGPERYVVTMLKAEYVVNLSDEQIFSVQPGGSLADSGFLEQLCLLAYLINAQDLPVANKLVKPEALRRQAAQLSCTEAGSGRHAVQHCPVRAAHATPRAVKSPPSP